jgi:hypothetical protein
MKSTTSILQAQVSAELHTRLRCLAGELDRDLDEIVGEALLLMLRYHDYAYGLVAPEAPVQQCDTAKQPREGEGYDRR